MVLRGMGQNFKVSEASGSISAYQRSFTLLSLNAEPPFLDAFQGGKG